MLKLPRNGQLQPVGKPCPICQYEVIEVTIIPAAGSDPTAGSSSHNLCPRCFHEAPDDPAVNPDGKASEFRCFMCTQAGCEFATGTRASDADVAKCPLCGRACALRTARGANNRYIGCSAGRNACNFVYWFPRDCIEGVVPVAVAVNNDSNNNSGQQQQQQQNCPSCNSRRLTVDWIRGKVPFGTRTFTGCIWCDSAWADVLRAIGEDGCIPTLPHPGVPAGQGRVGRIRGGRRASNFSTMFNNQTGSAMTDIEDTAGRTGVGRGGRGTRGRGRGARGQNRRYQNRGRGNR